MKTSVKTKKENGKVITSEPEVIISEKGNVIMVDTNVLINDPESIYELMKGDNLVIVPRIVLFELDNLKRKPETRYESRAALKIIHKLLKEKNSNFSIFWKQNFIGLELDKKVPDHNVIAAFNAVIIESSKKNSVFTCYRKFKLITDDTTMLIIAGELFASNLKVEIEPYQRIRVKLRKEPVKLRAVTLKASEYLAVSKSIIFNPLRYKLVKENDGILFKAEFNPFEKKSGNSEKTEFMAIRKGNSFMPIPFGINALGIKPLNEGCKNYKQYQYLAQLLDPEIKVVLVSGVAGTGKTLLALAAALEQRNLYGQIILTRPTTLLEDKDELGFLPGDLNSKMAEYIVPFVQDLEVIIEANDSDKSFFMKTKGNTTGTLIQSLRRDSISFLSELGIKINAIQHYRGRTYHNCFIIVDEAQNLTPHQIKTIITRVGKNTKIVLTGDLEQIDKRFLNSENSGLAYTMVKMGGDKLIGITVLTNTVRSEVASLAEKVL